LRGNGQAGSVEKEPEQDSFMRVAIARKAINFYHPPPGSRQGATAGVATNDIDNGGGGLGSGIWDLGFRQCGVRG